MHARPFRHPRHGAVVLKDLRFVVVRGPVVGDSVGIGSSFLYGMVGKLEPCQMDGSEMVDEYCCSLISKID